MTAEIHELTSLTIHQAAELIQKKEISPVDLTRAHLERIETVDPGLNAFLTVTPENALRRARQLEKVIQRGESSSPLLGIPVALKDLFETRGVRTTAGSIFFKNNIPAQDCTVVQRMVAGGAVILGKLNLHEWAFGVTNQNPHYGPCNNPWDIERIPGGSSGGCGAALAGELCTGALGSDSGGSIRIPAALCGVVGLKPTYGRVSLNGVIPLSWSLDHAGPMARCVRDVALLLQALAGYDDQDPANENIPVPDYSADLARGVTGWQIGLAKDRYFSETSPEIAGAVEKAAKVFERLGAKVIPIKIEGMEEAWHANGKILLSESAAYHRERLTEHPEKFGSDVLQRIKTGASFSATEYVQARQAQRVLRRQFEKLFQDFEVLLTPTTPVVAQPRAGSDALALARVLTRYTAPFNLMGLPALSLPCGLSSEALPIGLQIIAGPWREASALRAGYAYEQATAWSLMKPVF